MRFLALTDISLQLHPKLFSQIYSFRTLINHILNCMDFLEFCLFFQRWINFLAGKGLVNCSNASLKRIILFVTENTTGLSISHTINYFPAFFVGEYINSIPPSGRFIFWWSYASNSSNAKLYISITDKICFAYNCSSVRFIIRTTSFN